MSIKTIIYKLLYFQIIFMQIAKTSVDISRISNIKIYFIQRTLKSKFKLSFQQKDNLSTIDYLYESPFKGDYFL